MEILPKLIRNQWIFITFCSLAPRSGENFDVRVFWMRFPFDFDHYFVKSQRLMRGSATKKVFKKPGASRRKVLKKPYKTSKKNLAASRRCLKNTSFFRHICLKKTLQPPNVMLKW